MADALRIEEGVAGVARLVLDRPELHNAFDDALIAALTAALLRLEADPRVRVVVLAGAGTTHGQVLVNANLDDLGPYDIWSNMFNDFVDPQTGVSAQAPSMPGSGGLKIVA